MANDTVLDDAPGTTVALGTDSSTGFQVDVSTFSRDQYATTQIHGHTSGLGRLACYREKMPVHGCSGGNPATEAGYIPQSQTGHRRSAPKPSRSDSGPVQPHSGHSVALSCMSSRRTDAGSKNLFASSRLRVTGYVARRFLRLRPRAIGPVPRWLLLVQCSASRCRYVHPEVEVAIRVLPRRVRGRRIPCRAGTRVDGRGPRPAPPVDAFGFLEPNFDTGLGPLFAYRK